MGYGRGLLADIADQSLQVLESVECVKNELLANEDTLSLAQIAQDYQVRPDMLRWYQH
jgi:hypothetical protein